MKPPCLRFASTTSPKQPGRPLAPTRATDLGEKRGCSGWVVLEIPTDAGGGSVRAPRKRAAARVRVSLFIAESLGFRGQRETEPRPGRSRAPWQATQRIAAGEAESLA